MMFSGNVNKIVICVFVFAFLLQAVSASATWWDADWDYRKPITVTDSSGSELTDFQVPVDLTDVLYDNTGLVGSWHFSEGSGSVARDSSGNGNDGTLANGPVWVAGKFGNGLQFDGVDDKVITQNYDYAANSPISVALWFYSSVNSNSYGDSYSSLVDHAPDGNSGLWFGAGVGSNVNKLGMYTGSTYIVGSTEYSLGNWHYAVFTYDGTTATIYLDGVFNGSAVSTTSGSNRPFYIGGLGGWYGRFKGLIDEVKIYDRALSQAEIQDHFNASKGNLDYSDLRFADSGGVQEIPYWVESDNRVWVKVPSIPANGSTNIFMYYGNSSADSKSDFLSSFGVLGSGSDGALTVSSPGTVVNTYAYLTSGAGAGSNLITVSDGFGFSDDDEILVMQMQGNGAGNYEFRRIVSGGGTENLVLDMPLKNDYFSGVFNSVSSISAQVVRVPNYTDVTLDSGAGIIAPAWNGYTGGIISFRSNAAVLVNAGASIDASGKGFRGGDLGGCGNWGGGEKGESQVGYGNRCTQANGAGGGGGDAEWCHSGEGGAGGGYGTAGSNGQRKYYSCGGGWSCGSTTAVGGSAIGSPQLSELFFGGGGGSGGRDGDNPDCGGTGGAGGGIILISAGSVQVDGSVSSSGQNAPNDNTGETGGGGGGAGGSIYIVSDNASIGSSKVTASYGSGAPGVNTRAAGGNGGYGRVRLDYNLLTGTTTPSAYEDGFNPDLYREQVVPEPTTSVGSQQQADFPYINDLVFEPSLPEQGNVLTATVLADVLQGSISSYSFIVKRSDSSVFAGPITQTGNEYSFTPDSSGFWTVEVTATDGQGNTSSVFSKQVGVSGWWDSDWSYRKSVMITETSGSDLTDYPLSVDLTGAIYDNSGLVGSWHFSEGSGTKAADSSGNGNDGTLTNGPVWSTGKFGGGLEFDGADDYIVAGNDGSLDAAGEITVEAWVKFEDLTNSYYVVVDKRGGAGVYEFYWEKASTNLRFSLGGVAISSTEFTPELGQWYHIVALGVVGQSGKGKMYVNGADVTLDAGGVPSPVTGGNFTIGAYGGGAGEFFNGTIDEVKIYNRVLSQAEIQERFDAEKARLDLADLRFATGGVPKELSYWLESDNKAWVKVPEIQANSSENIYLYYGNQSADGVSSATETFDFFDDFEDASYNGWSVASGSWTASGNYLKGTSDGGVIYTAENVVPSGGKEWLFKVKNHGSGSGNDQYHPRMIHLSDNDYLKIYMRTYSSGDQYVRFIEKVGGSENVLHTSTKYNYYNERGNWFNVKVEKLGNNGKFKIWKHGTNEPSTWDWEGVYNQALADSGKFYNHVALTDSNGVGLDDVRVRKYTSPEPTASTGAQEQSDSPIVKSVSFDPALPEEGQSVTATATATDPQGTQTISSYTFTVKKPDSSVFAGPTAQSVNQYSFIPDGAGQWVVEVTATDAQGNRSSVFSGQLPVTGWWDSDWSYRKSVTITETSGSDLADFQVLVGFDSASLVSAGVMNSDCGDLRFADGLGLSGLSYWLESGCNTASTKVWVKVPSIPANSSTGIFMYYGNVSAVSASSDVDTFDSSGNWEVGWKYYRSASCTGPLDWTSVGFDDSTWTDLPDASVDYWASCDDCDWYMRKRVFVTSVGSSSVRVTSDDGQWVYSGNGSYIGHCGGGCHGSNTCVNTWDVTSGLSKGDNVVAVQCSERGGGEVCTVNSFNILNVFIRKQVDLEPTALFGIQEQFSAPVIAEISLNAPLFELGDSVTATATATDPNDDPIIEFDFRVLEGVGSEVLNPAAQASNIYSFVAEGEPGLWQVLAKAFDGEYWGSEFSKEVFVNDSGLATVGLSLDDGLFSNTELLFGSVVLTEGQATGTFTTGVISPVNFSKWGVVTFSKTTPGASTLTVDVLDASDDSVLVADVKNGQNISETVGSIPIKLRANFTSGSTPSLDSWDVSYYSQFKITVTDCSNPYSGEVTATATRVSDLTEFGLFTGTNGQVFVEVPPGVYNIHACIPATGKCSDKF
ncbi:MAG: DUF2341 domain-containing protein, partial [Candidatus Diapherotrites archaeon]|nr:DUF2341 domain-containing protein [Candidatus Diapherotrites archaeon]